MDCRLTLKTSETFLDLLNASAQKKEKVNLLIDENGMTRMEGLIRAMHNNKGIVSIEMENGDKIELNKIIAVNGIFLPEYGEC